MKIFEVIKQQHQQLLEGGKSDAVRYNSEVGLLISFCNGDGESFDPEDPESTIPRSMLGDPDATYESIRKLLAPVFDSTLLNHWVDYGKTVVRPLVVNKLIQANEVVDRFTWAGGKNQNAETSADVEFIGSTISGVSVKEKSGITLNNPTPKDLGIDNKGDLFLQYAHDEYMSWKTGIFTQVLDLAEKSPGVKVGGKDTTKYYVMFDSETNQFHCAGKTPITATADEIMKRIGTNAGWQRAFGDWFTANFATQKGLMAPLIKVISEKFVNLMKTHLSKDKNAAKLLKFVPRPFFYVNPQHVYYVPSINDVADLQLKDVKFADPDGATMKFFAYVGMKDSKENAQVEIHVRYANGMFEANPTARVQSLKNPQFLSWEELN